MKKLLVTAIGAAAALGAYAAGEISLLRFNELAEGATTISALNSAQGTYWSADQDATNNTYAIEAMGSYDQRQETAIASAPTKALSVKTTFGKPLSVNVVENGGETNINAGIYFDSLVKFTVCEDTPEQEYAGAKIVMWLQEQYDANDEITGTNLYVRAGYLSYNNGIQVSNAVYNCGEVAGNFADKFRRVTIKAISNITTDSDPVPGFAIYIDGNDEQGGLPIGTGSVAKWDSTFTAAYTLTEAAEYLANPNRGALFPSLDQTTGSKATLTAASFDGTGSITDILFTDEAPSFAEDYAAIKATVDDGLGTAGSIVPFKSLAAAVDYVNGKTTGTYTMMLSKGMPIDGTLAFASSANVILDFAGLVITNDGTTAAISNNGKLTITNSTVAVGGVYCSGEGAALVSGPQAYYTDVRDGCFWGAVSEQGLGALLLYGGSYAANTMTGSLAPGKVFSAQGATYQGLYDVVDYVAPTFWTITFNANGGTGTMADMSVEDGVQTNLTANAFEKANYTFEGWSNDPMGDILYADSASITPSADIALYAKWSATEYTITYKNADGTTFTSFVDGYNAPASFTVLSSETLPEAENVDLSLLGVTFEGWTNATGTAVTTTEGLTADLEVFAKTAPLVQEFTITFVTGRNDATVDPSTTNFVAGGSAITLPTPVINPPVTGVTFAGWTNDTMTITTEDMTYTPPASNAKSFTLYAKWNVVVEPTYPSYLDNADAAVKGQYNTWKANNNVADGDNDYEAAFLLNVAPTTGDTTLDATAVNISGTTVTITLDHTSFNGYVYLYSATTVAGLVSVTPTLVTPESGVISATSNDAAKFYKVVVSATPLLQ